MSGQPWTPKADATLRRLYPKFPSAEVARRMGRTPSAVRARAKKIGATARPYWTDAERADFRRLYPDADNAELAARFGRTLKAIQQQAKTLGVKKSPEYLRDLARRVNADREARGLTPGRFKPGLIPWNKGKKGWSAPGIERTQFKPGQRPHTWRPIGTEVIREGGLLYRKVRDDGPTHRHYKAVHIMVWEAAHGPVPRGHAIVFRDRLPKHINITLDRLELVTRAELMRRNSYHNLPDDIRGVITMGARLTRVINEKTKRLQEATP